MVFQITYQVTLEILKMQLMKEINRPKKPKPNKQKNPLLKKEKSLFGVCNSGDTDSGKTERVFQGRERIRGL